MSGMLTQFDPVEVRYARGPQAAAPAAAGDDDSLNQLRQALIEAALKSALATSSALPAAAIEQAGREDDSRRRMEEQAAQQRGQLRSAKEMAGVNLESEKELARFKDAQPMTPAEQAGVERTRAETEHLRNDPSQQINAAKAGKIAEELAKPDESEREANMLAARDIVKASAARGLRGGQTAQDMLSGLSKLLSEIRTRHPGRAGQQEAQRVGRVVVEGDSGVGGMYGLRPLTSSDQEQLAQAIIAAKESMYGPGNAGVSREQLTNKSPLAPGSLKRPWLHPVR